MNIEDIKVGETYNVRVKVDRVDTTFNAVFFTIEGGDTVYAFGVQDRKIHDLISPVIEVTGVCPPSKYDPYRKFRKFRKGDMVRYCAPDGRIYADRGSLREHIKNRDLTHVVRDEQENGRVGVYDPLDEENPYYVPAHSLELVTPVEELESYYIIDDDCNEEHPFYVIQNRNSKLSSGLDEEIMRFVYGQDYTADKETVLKRAEAECARLNAEYRKEREND